MKEMVFLCCFWLWLFPSCICFLVTQFPSPELLLDISLWIVTQEAQVGVSGVLAALTHILHASWCSGKCLTNYQDKLWELGCFSDEMAIALSGHTRRLGALADRWHPLSACTAGLSGLISFGAVASIQFCVASRVPQLFGPVLLHLYSSNVLFRCEV